MQLTDRFWQLLWYKVVKAVAGWAAAGAAIFGVGIICYQALGWLKTAYWKPYTIGEALNDLGVPDLNTSLLGLQKIIDTIVLWPASLAYLAVALLCGFTSLMAAEAETKIEWEQDRKREAAGKRKREPRTITEDLISWLGGPKE
jgi:hypothetical protein